MARAVGDQLAHAIFLHGSWGHILGNMLFLAIFGENVEDAFGRMRYLAFYIAGGFVATASTADDVIAALAAAATVPMLGASGAIAAVLAPTVLYPGSKVLALVFVFPAGSRPGCSSECGSCFSSRGNYGLSRPRRRRRRVLRARRRICLRRDRGARLRAGAYARVGERRPRAVRPSAGVGRLDPFAGIGSVAVRGVPPVVGLSMSGPQLRQ